MCMFNGVLLKCVSWELSCERSDHGSCKEVGGRLGYIKDEDFVAGSTIEEATQEGPGCVPWQV